MGLNIPVLLPTGCTISKDTECQLNERSTFQSFHFTDLNIFYHSKRLKSFVKTPIIIKILDHIFLHVKPEEFLRGSTLNEASRKSCYEEVLPFDEKRYNEKYNQTYFLCFQCYGDQLTWDLAEVILQEI